jgi:hypothetical protein
MGALYVWTTAPGVFLLSFQGAKADSRMKGRYMKPDRGMHHRGQCSPTYKQELGENE